MVANELATFSRIELAARRGNAPSSGWPRVSRVRPYRVSSARLDTVVRRRIVAVESVSGPPAVVAQPLISKRRHAEQASQCRPPARFRGVEPKYSCHYLIA